MHEIKSNFYRNLFHGAARLGLLLGSLDLPWTCIVPYISTFSEELDAYQELSLDGTGTMLGLMTRSTGKDFAFRLTRYMETNGIEKTQLRRFLVRARFFEHRNIFFKVEIGPHGPEEFSYYFRQRASLDVARAWLAETGVNPHSLALLDACAQTMAKETVHFLAAAVQPNGASIQKVYFSQPDDGEAWLRIQQASELIGLTLADWHPLEAYKSSFINKPLFFSLSFVGEHLCPGAKLDIQGVSPDTVEILMKQNGHSQEACDRSRLLLELFEKDHFDYLGLRLVPNAPLTTKVYVYQDGVSLSATQTGK